MSFVWWLLADLAYKLADETGGGSKPQPPQVIAAPPPPDVGDTARESLEAQLEFNPQLTQQAVELQQQYAPLLAALQAQLQAQYAPQYAQSQYDVTAQMAPQYRALLESQYPQIPMLSQQVTERLQSPQGLSAAQQAAQDAIRQRATERTSRNIRSEANLGGGLFGGRRELREDRALGELEQGFAMQDVALQDQRRQQTMQELISLYQIAGLPVQQFGVNTPQAPSFTQGVVPGGDNLYNALVQNQGNFGIIPGSSGTPGIWGGIGQGVGTGVGAFATAKAFMFCLAGDAVIDTPSGGSPMASLRAGEVIQLPDGSTDIVLMKYEYLDAPTDFVRFIFTDGTSIELCTRHLVDGNLAGTYAVGDAIQGRIVAETRLTTRTEKTYDLLTAQADGGYASSGIRIPSMIPLLHKVSQVLQGVA